MIYFHRPGRRLRPNPIRTAVAGVEDVSPPVGSRTRCASADSECYGHRFSVPARLSGVDRKLEIDTCPTSVDGQLRSLV